MFSGKNAALSQLSLYVLSLTPCGFDREIKPRLSSVNQPHNYKKVVQGHEFLLKQLLV